MRNDPAGPRPDCGLCPRLAAFRGANRLAFSDHFNAPVPGFGDRGAWLLVVGLAPGLHGANRTGRPFTGDTAGDLLYDTLLSLGLARGSYGRSADDGLSLTGCRIVNAVHCVPPANKPLPAEIRACRPFLAAEVAAMPGLAAVVCLGRIAHAQVAAVLGLKAAAHPFAHGKIHRAPGRPAVIDSYHCSRYNTNTRRLTPEMFRAVFEAALAFSPSRA